VRLPEETEPRGREPASILLRYTRAYVGPPVGTEPEGREPASILLRYTIVYVVPPVGTETEGREPASILLRYSLTWGFLGPQNLRAGNQLVFFSGIH
jgi:hypothetical protein